MERTAETHAPTTVGALPAVGEASRLALQAARLTLRALAARADGDGAVSMPGHAVTAEVNLILSELEGVDGAAPAPLRVPCDFCGRQIMPAATLCGFCWHARQAQTRDQPRTANAGASPFSKS